MTEQFTVQILKSLNCAAQIRQSLRSVGAFNLTAEHIVICWLENKRMYDMIDIHRRQRRNPQSV